MNEEQKKAACGLVALFVVGSLSLYDDAYNARLNAAAQTVNDAFSAGCTPLDIDSQTTDALVVEIVAYVRENLFPGGEADNIGIPQTDPNGPKGAGITATNPQCPILSDDPRANR